MGWLSNVACGWLKSAIISCVGGLDWLGDNDWSVGDERKLTFSVLIDISDLAGALVSDEEGILRAIGLESC